VVFIYVNSSTTCLHLIIAISEEGL